MSERNITRRADRPGKSSESRRERPKRSRIGNFRSILTIPEELKDPEYSYQWTVGKKDGSGPNIYKAKRQGFEFVEATDELRSMVGEDAVFKTSGEGSLIRIPSGTDDFLYLMRIPREWIEEDKREAEARRVDAESSFGPKEELGQYGSVKIERK